MQTQSLAGLSLEELNHLLEQANAQIAANTAQQSLVTAQAEVQVDNLKKQAITLAINVTNIQAAIAALPQ